MNIKPPIEYCPECLSLKRKPNKDCKNHNNHWIDKDEGLDRVIQDNLPATHLIEISKENKKYIVRCAGDYSDIVRGRSTSYEFSEEFKTLREARDYYKESMKDIIEFYRKHGKKAYVGLLEKI